jgi:hypothetical protein
MLKNSLEVMIFVFFQKVAASSTLRLSLLNDNSRHFCINEGKRHHWPLPHI